MHRWPSLLASFALGSVLFAVSGCGADDSGGGDRGDRDGGDGGDGGDGDGAPDAGGDQPDGSVGPGEPAEGEFQISEVHFGQDAFRRGSAFGSIVDPRPRYHRLEGSVGACQLWTYEVGSCEDCDGLCDAGGECVPFPVQLSAGQVTVDGLSEDFVMQFQAYGYYPPFVLPSELWDDGDMVALEAAGGADVPAFSLAAAGVDAIELELERGGGDGEVDTLRLEDGADLVLSWSPVAPGARVRLELMSNNRAHGLPVDVLIQCEAGDSGRMVVPRAFIEAFPDKPYQSACAGTDCPPSSLTRFRSDSTEVGGRDVILEVAAQREFIVVHERR
jgi:hypothetical protein